MARRLIPQANSAYGLPEGRTALFPSPIIAQRAPLTSDKGYPVGQLWVNSAGNTAFILTSAAAGSAVWALASPGASDVDTINGLSPAAGNIVIAGGTNITDVNGGNTVTLNLDAAITLVTSVTSPIYASAAAMAINPVGALTITGGTTIDINAAANEGVTIQLGDAVGAEVFEIEDSASATVATIDSNGIATFVGMDGVLGGVTPAAVTGTTITANTSFVGGTYTAPAATDLGITSIAGQNINVTLGDNAGANLINFIDTIAATVASIDSNGNATFVAMDGIVGSVTPAAITGTTITANTSVTSPTYTAAAADAVLEAGGVNDVILRLGDNAGATFLRVQDSDSADVWTVDSNGGIGVFAGLTVAGAFAQTAGTFDVGQDNAADAINIGGGNVARAIGLGNSAAAHTITIGNAASGAITVDTAAGISLDSATASNFTVTGAGVDLSLQGVGGAVNMTSTQAENDAILIEASDAVGGVQIRAGSGGILIGNEADTAYITLGLNAPTVDRTITIGAGTVVTAAVDDILNIGTGGATTNADSTKTVNINTGGVTLGVVETNIGSGAVTSGTHTTNIDTGARAAGTMVTNISTSTGTKAVNVGNVDGLTTVGILGISNINTTGTAATSIGSATGGIVAVDSDANFSINADDASTISVTAGTLDLDSSAALSINSSAGVLNFGNDDIDQAVNVGTDGERTVTVGSVNGAAALVLQSGTGEITMTGTVKQIDAELMGATGVYIPVINMSPVMTTAATTGGIPTGATGDTNLMSLQNQAIMSQFILGAGQTIIAPRMSANGLLISLDLTATEGAEYGFEGALDSTFGFTVGTSGAFFFELDLYINDMDGADPYIFGFRKTEANNATFADYTDYYALGMSATTSATELVIFDELNSSGQTITNTTDLWGGDGTTNTLRIDVSAAGVCTSYINGVIATAAPAFTFDADRVTPFIRLTHSANPTQVAITGMRIGLQA